MKITYLPHYCSHRLGMVIPIVELQPGEVGKRTTWGGLYRIHDGEYQINRTNDPDDNSSWEWSEYNNPKEEYNARKNSVVIVRES